MRNLKIAGATLFALLLIVAVSFSVSRQSLPPAADTPAVEQAAGHACRHLGKARAAAPTDAPGTPARAAAEQRTAPVKTAAAQIAARHSRRSAT